MFNLRVSRLMRPQVHAYLCSDITLNAVPRVIGKVDDIHMVDLGNPWGFIRKAADLQDVHIHDLRHSFASVAASEGASLHVIGKLLGHTQTATTASYAHLIETSLQVISSSVDNTIADALKA